MNGVAENLLTVRVPFEQQDLVAGRKHSPVTQAIYDGGYGRDNRHWRTSGTERRICVRGNGVMRDVKAVAP